MWDMLDLVEGSNPCGAPILPLGPPTPALTVLEKGALSQLDTMLHQLSAGFTQTAAHRQQQEKGANVNVLSPHHSATIPDSAWASTRAGQHIAWDSPEEQCQSPTSRRRRLVLGVKAESEHSELTALSGLHARLSSSLPASPVCASALEAAVRGSLSATITQVLPWRVSLHLRAVPTISC